MKKALKIILTIVVAAIMLLTVPSKFMGAEDAVALFTTLGVEPWGRIGLGIVELLAAILVIVPKTQKYGAALVAALMAGALGTHALIIGFEGAAGELALMAGIAFIASLGLLRLNNWGLCALMKKNECCGGGCNMNNAPEEK